MADTEIGAPLAAAKHSDDRRDAEALGLAPRGDSLVARSVTINRPARELYDFWRDFTNLPSFMDNIQRIERLDGQRSHWVVAAPAGQTVEWEARVTEDEPGRALAWASQEGSGLANSGRVTFSPVEGRGTVVTATILYDPPAGALGKLVAKLFQREPAIQARRDLRRFKQLMETGEVATSARNRRLDEEEQA